MRRIALFVAVALTLGFSISFDRASHAQEGFTPTFEAAECPFTVPFEAEAVNCGYVTVPLDRTQAASPTIRLAVAVFPAQTDNPVPDPVIYLSGGPGGESLRTAEFQFESLVAPHLPYRDVILFDQRGVGYSEPSLECEGLRAFEFSLFEDDRPYEAILADYQTITARCRDELSAVTDLNAINTTQNAADVDDILAALGYGQYNLYGISYGTMLAQFVMRDHPDNIRAVVIDSNVPLPIDLYENVPANFERSLGLLVEACQVDVACNAAYPDFATVLETLYAELNANPIRVEVSDPLTGTVVNAFVNGDTLLGTLFGSLYSEQLFPLIPRAVYDLAAGEDFLFGQLLGVDVANAPYASSTMYFATMCNDEIPFNSPDEYLAEIAQTRPILQALYGSELESVFWVCDLFDDGTPPAAIDNELVISDIPTLVVSGQFDPITPPAWGDIVAAGLSNSYVVVYPNAAHGATTSSACATEMMVAFLNDPSAAPDDSCMADLRVSFSVPFTGAVELSEREIVDPFGTTLVAQVPADWEDLGSGTLAPPSDVTTGLSVLLFPTNDVQQTIDTLSETIAFDNPLPNLDLGGRTWQLYRTELSGINAILALAENDGNGVFVVIILASADELEALQVPVLQPLLATVRVAE